MTKYKVVLGIGIGAADGLHFDRMIEYTFGGDKTYVPVFDIEEEDLGRLKEEVTTVVNNVFDKFAAFLAITDKKEKENGSND